MNILQLTTAILVLSLATFAVGDALPGGTAAIQSAIDANEIPGAVTAVVTKDKLIDLQAIGFADVEAHKPMTPDSMFWIKSMTKPVTAVAVLMLQDEGKLNVEDKVAKAAKAAAKKLERTHFKWR
jgi:CubicO group peptidase (beta-lactamase class C family)